MIEQDDSGHRDPLPKVHGLPDRGDHWVSTGCANTVARRVGAETSPEPDTRSAMPAAPTMPVKRRPQWRGERRAVLVRLPVTVADRLRDEAARAQQSVSDTAAQIISAGVGAERRP